MVVERFNHHILLISLMTNGNSPFFKNAGRGITFNAANSTTAQLLYTPSKKAGIDLSGYIVDFTIECEIRSVTELSPTASTILATRTEQAADYYSIAKTHPSKRFLIYFEYPDAPGVLIRRAIALLWNRNPYYTLDLIPRLTKRNTVMIGPGVKVWGKFEDDPLTTWNGVLEGNDTAVINLAASEEAPDSQAFEAQTPEILNLTLTDADTQYPLVVPDGTRRFYLKARGDADEPIADIRYAWQPGIVAARTGSYDIVSASSEDGETGVWLVGKTLYLASDTPGVVVVLRIWK